MARESINLNSPKQKVYCQVCRQWLFVSGVELMHHYEQHQGVIDCFKEELRDGVNRDIV